MRNASPFSPVTAAVVAAAVSLSFATAAQAAKRLECAPPAGPIAVDGVPDEWDALPATYLEDSLRVVAVTHDDRFLYLMFRFGDARLAEQLARRGVVFWINGDGKKKNRNDAFGVRYAGSREIADSLELRPMGGPRPRGEDEPQSGAEPPSKAKPPSGGDPPAGGDRPGPPPGAAPGRVEPGTIVVIRDGFKETFADNEPEGYAAASTRRDEAFAYELRIPIAEIGGEVAAAPATARRRVAIGIQIGGMTDAERELAEGAREGQRGGPGGGPSGGMGGGMSGPGGMGGGMSGGMGPGGGQPPGGGRDFSEPEIVWLVADLLPASGASSR